MRIAWAGAMPRPLVAILSISTVFSPAPFANFFQAFCTDWMRKLEALLQEGGWL